MADLSLPARDSVAAQHELFRRAASEEGLTIAILAKRGPLSKSTMKGWQDGAAMPAWALGALGAAGVPDHLLSLITEPFSRFIVTDDGEESDLDTAATAATEFGAEVQKSRSPKSPGGLAIVPQEAAVIHQKRQRAVALMRRAA